MTGLCSGPLAALIGFLTIAGVSSTVMITCDVSGNVQRLNCDKGVIFVKNALYGRRDDDICSEGILESQLSNTMCSEEGVLDQIRTWCNGKEECELNVDVFHSSDPCPGTCKYLETDYVCVPAGHRIICEHSATIIKCEEGQKIHIYGADYGRRDDDICSYHRPLNELQDVCCSLPTDEVAEICNGENSCLVIASNSVFGDPCPGTYKYLEVSWVCLCK